MPDPTDVTTERGRPPDAEAGGRLTEAASNFVGPRLPDSAEKGRELERGGVLPPLKIEGSPKPEPKIGTQVQHRGETLTLVGESKQFSLLYKAGRNATYASVALEITEGELKEKYEKVRVTIDGKTRDRYVAKPLPGETVPRDRMVYALVDRPGGGAMLWTEHAYVAVAKPDIAGGAPKAPDRTTGTKVEAERGTTTPDADKEKTVPGKSEASGVKAEAVSATDAVLREGTWHDGKPGEERARLVDGVEVKVRCPKDGWPPWREVEIDGKTTRLSRTGSQQWFYSQGNVPRGQVKLHVIGVSEADLIRLQKELLPLLEELRAKGDIEIYKTFDPNFIDSKWKSNPCCFSTVPGPEGQDSKAFTIYVPQKKAAKVAAVIDQRLKKTGLVLDGYKGDGAGELTRRQSDSKRVSVERDHWMRTTNNWGGSGALLEEVISKKLHEKYGKTYGTTPEGRLTEAALRAAEKAAGLAADQLCYDRDGRLMFEDANPTSTRATNGRFYVDESESCRERGRLTGRPALYAVYEDAGLDPAGIYTDQLKGERAGAAVAPERVVPTLDRLATGDTRAQRDGTVERTEARIGDEARGREALERRERIEPHEIETLKRQAEELAASDKAEDRQKSEALKEVVRNLEGKNGPHAQEITHRKVIAEAQRAAERAAERATGGYAKAVIGGTTGVAILVSSALAVYRAQQDERREPLERATISKK